MTCTKVKKHWKRAWQHSLLKWGSVSYYWSGPCLLTFEVRLAYSLWSVLRSLNFVVGGHRSVLICVTIAHFRTGWPLLHARIFVPQQFDLRFWHVRDLYLTKKRTLSSSSFVFISVCCLWRESNQQPHVHNQALTTELPMCVVWKVKFLCFVRCVMRAVRGVREVCVLQAVRSKRETACGIRLIKFDSSPLRMKWQSVEVIKNTQAILGSYFSKKIILKKTQTSVFFDFLTAA